MTEVSTSSLSLNRDQWDFTIHSAPRRVHTSSQRELRGINPRPCPLRLRVPSRLFISHSDWAYCQRFWVHDVDVLQTLLFGRSNSRRPPSYHTREFPRYRPGTRYESRSLRRWSFIQSRVQELGIQWFHQSSVDYGRRMVLLLGLRPDILRRHPSGRQIPRFSKPNHHNLTVHSRPDGIHRTCIRRKNQSAQRHSHLRSRTTTRAEIKTLLPQEIPNDSRSMGRPRMHVLVRHDLLLHPRCLGSQPPRLWRNHTPIPLVTHCRRQLHRSRRNHSLPLPHPQRIPHPPH